MFEGANRNFVVRKNIIYFSRQNEKHRPKHQIKIRSWRAKAEVIMGAAFEPDVARRSCTLETSNLIALTKFAPTLLQLPFYATGWRIFPRCVR